MQSALDVRIGFSTSHALISRAINRATNSAVSHAFFIYRSRDFDRELIMHAWWSGFGVTTREHFEQSNTIVDIVRPVIPLDDALKHAADWLGDQYDYAGIVGMVPVLIARACKRRIKNPWHSPGSLFCSDAIAVGLRLVGYPDSSTLDPTTTTPGGLDTFMHAPEHCLLAA
jgi:hypothetical protein